MRQGVGRSLAVCDTRRESFIFATNILEYHSVSYSFMKVQN